MAGPGIGTSLGLIGLALGLFLASLISIALEGRYGFVYLSLGGLGTLLAMGAALWDGHATA